MLKTLKGKMSLVYIGLVVLIAFVGMVSIFNTMFLRRSVDGSLQRITSAYRPWRMPKRR